MNKFLTNKVAVVVGVLAGFIFASIGVLAFSIGGEDSTTAAPVDASSTTEIQMESQGVEDESMDSNISEPDAETTQPPIRTQDGTRVGVTLTHESIDVRNGSWGTLAPQLAEGNQKLINTHLHAFGMVSPAIAQGSAYDWSLLDKRIDAIRQAGGEPVLTLCCAPGWMTGTGDDWDFNAPLASHYDDFAKLSAAAAERYTDVQYFLVWNEFKGFYNSEKNRWDYEAYTELYNEVYTQVKAVRPDAQIGGPYVVMENWHSAPGSSASEVSGDFGTVDQRALDAVSYWLENSVGAEFVTIDGVACPTREKGILLIYCTDDERTQNEYFGAVAEWISGQTDLPIWWAEFYPSLKEGNNSEEYKQEIFIDALEKFGAGGGDVALLWSEECGKAAFAFGALWSCDGQTLPLHDAIASNKDLNY